MTIRFTCSECASVMKIKDELAGTSARCPKCKTKFVVPDPTSDAGHSASDSTLGKSAIPPSNGSGLPHHDEPVDGALSEEVKSRASQAPQASVDPADFHLSLDDSAEFDAVKSNASPPDEKPPAAENQSGPEEPFQRQLKDGDDGSPAPLHEVETGEMVAVAVNGSSAEQEVDDDLDCPSMIVSSFLAEMKSETPAAEPKRFAPSRVPPDVASDYAIKTPRTPTSPRHEDAPSRRPESVDPMKFLMDDPPPRRTDDFSPRSPGPMAYSSAPDSDADLSLSDESDDEIPIAPTPLPVTRRAPAPSPSRPTPEKIDLATAARMMKKAIKDSQADATRQRELDARPGFDYTLFFREFGLRGMLILAVAIAGPVLMYFAFDYMMSSRLKTPKLGYVTGVVKLDGKPVSNVNVFMAPTDPTIDGNKKSKERARTSVGVTDASGQYKMMYTPKIQGVAAGKCRVWLNGPEVTPDWMEVATRTLEVTVGSQAPYEINMESRKKK